MGLFRRRGKKKGAADAGPGPGPGSSGTDGSAYAFVSEKNGLSMADARALQEAFQAALAQNNISVQVNAAARLMTAGAYNEAIDAYSVLVGKYPDARGEFEGQIGAAHFFLGDYNTAIEFYLAAREHGESAEMIDDNIWEACEALVKQSGNPVFAQRYLDTCPKGKYREQAHRLVK